MLPNSRQKNSIIFITVPNQMHKVSKDQMLVKPDEIIVGNNGSFDRNYVIKVGRALKSKVGL